ncbi:hypothetical protein L0244_28665 [bacterium]|nr:hypothetical protein [bacterium]
MSKSKKSENENPLADLKVGVSERIRCLVGKYLTAGEGEPEEIQKYALKQTLRVLRLRLRFTAGSPKEKESKLCRNRT